jgi:hypothetical protein
MSIQTRELYRSTNGDRWYLVRDSESGRVLVRHEPNLPSGGQIADIEIGAFLSRGSQDPENAPNRHVGRVTLEFERVQR